MLAPGTKIGYVHFSCRDVAQSGRAPRSGRGGRWFKSSRPDHLKFLIPALNVKFIGIKDARCDFTYEQIPASMFL